MEYNGDRHEGNCPNWKAARKRAEKKPVKSPLVYPGRKGGPLNDIRECLNSACKRAGIPHIARTRASRYLRFANGNGRSRPLRHHEGHGARRYQDDDDLRVAREKPHKGAGGETKRDPFMKQLEDRKFTESNFSNPRPDRRGATVGAGVEAEEGGGVGGTSSG